MENLCKWKFNFQKTFKNIVVKGGIAQHEEFLLLLQYFQRLSPEDMSKRVCKWERVNLFFQEEPVAEVPWSDQR